MSCTCQMEVGPGGWCSYCSTMSRLKEREERAAFDREMDRVHGRSDSWDSEFRVHWPASDSKTIFDRTPPVFVKRVVLMVRAGANLSEVTEAAVRIARKNLCAVSFKFDGSKYRYTESDGWERDGSAFFSSADD